MKLTIKEKKEKPLLNRIEIKGILSFDKATPPNAELQKNIANSQKIKPGLVVIKHIYTAYGKPEAEILAYVYNSEKDLKNTEPKPKKKPGKPGEQKVEAAAPVAESPAKEEAPKKEKQEKPAEEKKEAPKKEEKSE